MPRVLCLLIGAVGYAIGMAALVLFILFAGGWQIGSLSIDAPPKLPVAVALLVNIGLVGCFGLQHTVMARPWFKRWWTRFVPEPIERSVYCVATGVVIGLLCFLWQPLPGVVWTTDSPILRAGLTGLQLLGWATTVASSFMISHTELFGLRQAGSYAAGRPEPETAFIVKGLYRFVRHPLQMGVLVGLWATPHMSVSHMFFSAMVSAYVLIGLHHEERDLVATYGDDYLAYKRRVPMLVPFVRGSQRAPSRVSASPADSAA